VKHCIFTKAKAKPVIVSEQRPTIILAQRALLLNSY